MVVASLTAGPAMAEVPPISFTAPQSYEVGSIPDGTAIGDVNGDGWLDALVTTSFHVDTDHGLSLFVFHGRPDGSLADEPTQFRLPTEETSPTSVATGDFTGDGRTDAFVTSYGGSFLYRQHNHALVLAQTFPKAYYYSHLNAEPADLDSDGYTDVLLNTSHSGALILLQRSGKLVLSPLTPAVNRPLDGVRGQVADLTGDGRPDVVAFGRGPATLQSHVNVFPQLPDGRFGTPTTYLLASSTYVTAMGLGDVNNDGRTDVVPVNDSQAIVMLQKPDGTLASYNEAQLLTVQGYTDAVTVGDTNGDGRSDLVLGQDSTSIAIFLQQTDGTLGLQQNVRMGYGTHVDPRGLKVGDISGDGLNDLVISDAHGFLQVARNLGTPPPLETSIASGPGSMRPSAVMFGLAANRGGAAFECSLDGAEYTSCTSPVAYAGLEPDTGHVFRARATWNGQTDTAAAERSVHVGKFLPSISLTTDRPQYRTGATARIRLQVSGSETRRVRLIASRLGGTVRVLFDGVLPSAGLTLDRTATLTETFTAQTLGDSRHDAATASVRPVVHAALRISASRPVVHDGRFLVYRASADPVLRTQVIPARANLCLRFHLQRREASGVWRTARTSTCQRTGSLGAARWTLTGRQPTGDAFRVRATFAGDNLNGSAASSWIYLRFRR